MQSLDDKDKKLINLLQKDSRMLLKDLSKAVGLSIDSTHKRLKKLIANQVIFLTAQVNPREIGYPLALDVKIKLKDIDEKRYNQLISYLKAHPNVISVFSVSSDYDLTTPIIAKDYEQLNQIRMEIRQRFKDIIADWKEALNLKFYKYEEYDLEKL